MLNLTTVSNSNIKEIYESVFDIAIFASGYESRATYLADKLDSQKILNSLILGFIEYNESFSRSQNDIFYKEKFGDIFLISSQEEKLLYSELILVFNKVREKKHIRILIDYTSMSRLWYAGILNFLRFQSDIEIEVFLNYCPGKYDNKFLDYSYSAIKSIPSHEGSLSSNSKTLLVLAIGFSPFLVKSVIEEIEPNKIIGILPVPKDEKDYQKRTKEIKENILTKDIDDWFSCSIDLETIFRTYAEVTSNNINDKDIIFLSLGPKIFTLASLLISQRFPQITCLFLKVSKSFIADVPAKGDFICSKIIYK